MSTIQPALFDGDDLPSPVEDRALVIRPTAARRLTPQERAFNRALQRVQALRQRLEAEKHRLDRALMFHAAEVSPRVERTAELRAQLVRAMVPFLDHPRLSRSHREVLHAMLVQQLDAVLRDLDTPAPDLQAVFERLHGLAYAEAVQQEIDETRSAMGAMFDELGLDVDVPELRADMSDAERATTAAQFVDDLRRMMESQSEAEPARRKTKRELREEERARRLDQMRKEGIASVYRRLAKALHPDLERDENERQKKIDRMQQVTTAYGRGDLHTLLRLEAEWIDGARADTAQLGAERLQAYTELLKEQARELEAECETLWLHPRYQPLAVDGPFGMSALIDGPSEVARLDEVIVLIEQALERLAADALKEIRGTIEEYRRAHKIRQRHPRRR